MDKKSFAIGALSMLCFMMLFNATSEYLGFDNPNNILNGKAVFWDTPNISALFGDTTANTLTSNGELRSREHRHNVITESQRLELIEESAQTGAVFSYFIEDVSAELEIGLGHIEGGVDYRWKILNATATIALTTDTFRVVANGKERGIASLIETVE